MIINKTSLPCHAVPPAPTPHSTEQILYIDIETTGLSASSSYIYLIGCTHIQNNAFHIIQWLAAEPSEEKELLSRFLTYTKAFTCLVQFNGISFALPFLEKKCIKHGLSYTLSRLEAIDYYKLLQPYKKLLSLSDLKRNTLFEVLHLLREDTCSDSELTALYTVFVGNCKHSALTGQTGENELLKNRLLLHNRENLTILPVIGSLLHTLQSLAHTEQDVSDIRLRENTLQLTLATKEFKPFPCTLQKNEQTAVFTATLRNDAILLSIPLYCGELKHFFPNYKDYCYLPLEDTAIHASIAVFVEKKHRKKATAATCYTRTSGTFFPCPASFFTEFRQSLPFFFTEYKNKLSYLLLAKELITDTAFWQRYSNSVLSFLLEQKKNSKRPATKTKTEIN